MDFNKFDTRAAAEIGQKMPIRHPHNGEIITTDDGEPCCVLVTGSQSRALQADVLKEAKAKMAKKDGKDETPASMEEIQQMLVKAAAKVIVGFEGVEFDGKPATKEDAERFLDLNFVSLKSLNDKDSEAWNGDSFAQQVLKFSNDIENYLGNASAA